jgi:gamma-D-glutamyl-L-lysine dipeptidyl-peptidase
MRCAVEIAAVRAAPEEEAEQVTQALLYEPLTLQARQGGWARVLTAYGYGGWIKAGVLEDRDGELPKRRASTTPLEVARSYLGSSYEWGGLTEQGIDCSGLVHIAYRESGRLVPRDACQQEEAGSHVAPGAERPGDLVTYGSGARADHIAFWLDEGRILHATAREGLGVVEEEEPEELQVRRRFIVRLEPGPACLPNE